MKLPAQEMALSQPIISEFLRKFIKTQACNCRSPRNICVLVSVVMVVILVVPLREGSKRPDILRKHAVAKNLFQSHSTTRLEVQSNQSRRVDVASTSIPTKHKLLLFWTTVWHTSFEGYMSKCFPASERCGQLCRMTFDRQRVREADVIIFHVVDIDSYPSSRTAEQLWVLFTLEAPTHGYVSPVHDGLFNLTMTYRSDSDVEAGYGRADEVTSDQNHSLQTMLADGYAKRKPYAFWMVSNCNGARMEYVQELAKHIQVDIFGGCAPPGSRSCTKSSDCEAELSAEYAFYLAFENSLCTDYITEKFWRTLSLSGGAIPVVIGASPSRYAKVAPPGSFVHAESFASPRELAAHLKHVASHPELFMSYNQWRDSYRISVGSEYEVARGLCRLCEAMHEHEFRPLVAKGNLSSWFRSDCRTEWPIHG